MDIINFFNSVMQIRQRDARRKEDAQEAKIEKKQKSTTRIITHTNVREPEKEVVTDPDPDPPPLVPSYIYLTLNSNILNKTY